MFADTEISRAVCTRGSVTVKGLESCGRRETAGITELSANKTKTDKHAITPTS